MIAHPSELASEPPFPDVEAEPAPLEGQPAEPVAEYWRRELAGIPPMLELPFDFPRGGDSVATPGPRSLALPTGLRQSLQELCRNKGVSPFELFLAAFQTLLYRWTHQTNIVLGARASAADGLVAFHGRLAGNLAFEKILRQTRAQVAEARANPISIDALVEALAISPRADLHPVFQVLLQFDSAPSPRGRASVDVAPFDLALAVIDVPGACELILESGRGLFAVETLDRLLQGLAALLEGIVAEPGETLGMLPIVAPAERWHLIMGLNGAVTPYDQSAGVHELFLKQARRIPEAIALVAGEERWTYAMLDAKVEELAANLRAAGVGPDVLVGVFLPRAPQLVVGILGVLRAGGAYVPLDPAYPEERRRFILADTQMPVLVTERSLLADVPPGAAKVICVDALPPESTHGPASDLPGPSAQPHNLGYVIYTSGSTGKPKGVCVDQRCVVAFIAWAATLFTDQDLSGVLFATSACFDVSIFECLVPLCLGGRIIVTNNVLEISNHGAREAVTLVSGVPSALGEVVRARALPGSVRTVVLAGEPCPQSLVDSLYALGHVERVYDLYGPTETTVYSAGGLRRAGGLPSIGRPLPNEQVYLLDANLQLVPQGVRGELFIGGAKLARGYLNRPELTAEKFLNVPGLPAERLYRTGDAARWRADGTLEFLGRLDRQVKIRGFRVEPGEVEDVLRGHAAVKECAVVPRDDVMGAKILVAYIVGAAPMPDFDDLRRFLGERMPEYLVPSAFVALPALPRAPNGKLDAKALPAPDGSAERQRHYAPPRDAVEQQLVRVWEDVLSIKPIGIHDRFCDLGGHSLLAMRIAREIEAKFGRRIPISIFYQAPTIELLAAAIRQEGLIATRSCLVELQPNGTRPPIFWLHTLGGGGGGGLFIYQKLADLLGPDQPSYGLIARNEQQPDTFEELAATYLKEIRAVQPKGPYHLGGYCFGAVLAYEVARQLAASGDEIALVILLDAAPPTHPRQPGLFSRAFFNHLRTTLPDWLAEAGRGRRALARRIGGFGRRLFRQVLTRRAGGAETPETLPLAHLMDMDKYPAEYRVHAEAHWRAVNRYRPPFFPCRLALLRPHRPRLTMYAPEFQWRLWGHEVEVKEVPGDHTNLLAEPHVNKVAGAIRSLLEGGQTVGV